MNNCADMFILRNMVYGRQEEKGGVGGEEEVGT